MKLRISILALAAALFLPASVLAVAPPDSSRYVDSNPVLSPDGKSLMFTTRRPENKGGLTDGSGQYFEDVWVSRWDSVNSKWGQAAPMEGRINTPSYDASLSFSADGSVFYVYRNLGELGSGEIFYSKRSKKTGKYGSPKPFAKPINTSYFETAAALTADGKTMFFVSERKGGQGQADLWMSVKKGREWQEPTNLGATINTPLDEISVWCDSTGKTLFFSSNGHLSVGGYDIYKTTFESEGWTPPVNLGYPLNTVMDERQFTLSADKKTAFYITENDDGYGSYDIHTIDLSNYDIVATQRGFNTYVELTGMVTVDGKHLKGAKVVCIDKATKRTLAEGLTDRDGKYVMEVPGEMECVIKLTAEGQPKQQQEATMTLERNGKTTVTVDFALE